MLTRRHFLIALLALQLADVATTWVALGYGTHHEGNPFAAWILGYGLPGLLLAKLVGTAIIVLMGETLAKEPRGVRWADGVMMGCCLVMLLVVVNNWSIVLNAKP